MCYHVSVLAKNTAALSKALALPEYDPPKNVANYKMAYHLNGFDKPFLPVIRPEHSGWVLDTFQWGLIPEWVKAADKWKANTLNARNDELFEKPSYRDYWENRCLVVVSGFFEPRTETRQSLFGEEIIKNGKTESWYIHHSSKPFMTLGGIFYKDTVSVITTEASPLLSKIHNEGQRMPLILDEGVLKERWLTAEISKDEMTHLMLSHPDDRNLTAFRTIDGVMNSHLDTNVPEVIRPLA